MSESVPTTVASATRCWSPTLRIHRAQYLARARWPRQGSKRTALSAQTARRRRQNDEGSRSRNPPWRGGQSRALDDWAKTGFEAPWDERSRAQWDLLLRFAVVDAVAHGETHRLLSQ